MPDESRLPPFPDELVMAADKGRAIAFLRGLGLPGRIASNHLRRWGQYTGVAIERVDFLQVEGQLHNRRV